jgi:hypothetical protein
MIIVQCRRVKYRLLKYYYFYYTITNFGQALYLADDARAKLCATVNGKLNAAQERQTKSPTSTTGTGTTSRSMQNYLNANTESESRHGVWKARRKTREKQLKEALEKHCFHHGEIREEDVKLSGKGIYSRKKHTDTNATTILGIGN